MHLFRNFINKIRILEWIVKGIFQGKGSILVLTALIDWDICIFTNFTL